MEQILHMYLNISCDLHYYNLNTNGKEVKKKGILLHAHKY